MSRRANKINPDWSYADTFDQVMGEHFGEVFKTEWNIFSGSFGGYTTVRENGKKMTAAMAKVGRSVAQAIAAGRGAYE